MLLEIQTVSYPSNSSIYGLSHHFELYFKLYEFRIRIINDNPNPTCTYFISSEDRAVDSLLSTAQANRRHPPVRNEPPVPQQMMSEERAIKVSTFQQALRVEHTI